MRCADRCRRTAEALKRESRKPGSKRATRREAVKEEASTCPVCGTKFFATADREFCPVCILRCAASGESAADEEAGPASGSAVSSGNKESALPVRRFQHYEVASDEAGRPIELGRGAMGITYKALDVDLRCAVTLKVISEQYLGDESARLRFLREARAAASVRHPNVASVLHLARTASSYFYAMEFVDGETLENLIKRSGRLEVKLALEIATQVAAGLAAVHKQKLVHRDIKPSNIMVSLEEGGAVTAKIIDLGLAKSLDDQGAQTAISTPGAFAGTPEFASPEQFAGIGGDIRSDLYSLGITLWEMVTGKTPFGGTPGEVMYQHQHTPLPLGRLQDVLQPVVVLLEKLLEKDPARRFQTPSELLKAMPTITGAIAARRRVTGQSPQRTPATASRAGTPELPVRQGLEKISIARLPVTASDIFGREEISFFWIKRGQTRISTSLPLSLGLASGSRHLLTIGSDGWLRTVIVQQSSFLVGPSTDKVPAATLRPRMNFLMLLLPGLEIQIHGSEQRGRRANDSRSSSRIGEPC